MLAGHNYMLCMSWKRKW